MNKQDREYVAELEKRLKKAETELITYKQEYKLAISANHQLAALTKVCTNCQEAVDAKTDVMCVKCHQEVINRSRLMLFAFVRNSSVAIMGHKLGKTEQEITDKVFETIEEAEKIVDFEKMRGFMNLASKKENRYDN